MGQSTRTGLHPRVFPPTLRPAQGGVHNPCRSYHSDGLPLLQRTSTPQRGHRSSNSSEAWDQRGLAVLCDAIPGGPALLLQLRFVPLFTLLNYSNFVDPGTIVEFTYPADDEPAVRDPPLSALRGHRPPGDKRRGSGGGPGSIPTVASTSRDFEGRRSPPGMVPPRGPVDRRTPGPADRRGYGRPPPPDPVSGFYGQPGYYH